MLWGNLGPLLVTSVHPGCRNLFMHSSRKVPPQHFISPPLCFVWWYDMFLFCQTWCIRAKHLYFRQTFILVTSLYQLVPALLTINISGGFKCMQVNCVESKKAAFGVTSKLRCYCNPITFFNNTIISYVTVQKSVITLKLCCYSQYKGS